MNGQVGIEDTVLVSGEIDVGLKPHVSVTSPECFACQVAKEGPVGRSLNFRG